MIIAKIICRIRSFFRFSFDQRKRILVVKDDGLGDVIKWLPYGKLLREKFPADQYKIFMLVQKHSFDLCVYAGCADKVIALPAERKRFSWLLYRLKFWLFYRFDRIYIVTAFQNDMIFPYGKSTVKVALHKKKDSYLYKLSDCCETIIYCDGMSVHQYYQEIMKNLGIDEVPGSCDYSGFANTAEEEGDPQKPFCVVCPGASASERCWEEGKFVSLIDKLISEFGISVVLVGNAMEWEKCERIRKSCREPAEIFNMSGKTSLSRLWGLISRSRFWISNETGTCHLGTLSGIPGVIICGQGDYGTFVPYPSDREGFDVFSVFASEKCSCSPCRWHRDICKSEVVARCVANITVEQVFQTVSGQLINSKRVVLHDLSPAGR